MGSLRAELTSVGLLVLSLSLFYSECWGVAEVQGYPPSVNCKIQDCVDYQVVHSQKEFEIRIYKTSKWISSNYITTVSYNEGYSACYIAAYIVYKGENVERFVYTEDTQPVLTDIIPKTSYDSTYRSYLLVPKGYQNHVPTTPTPTQDVKVVDLPPAKFAAVTRFDGHLTDKTIAAGLAALKKALKGTPWESAAASPNCTVADYQFQKFDQKENRVNEVIIWFDAKN